MAKAYTDENEKAQHLGKELSDLKEMSKDYENKIGIFNQHKQIIKRNRKM